MSSDFVIDTFAWVEYFKGTKKGIKVKEVIENHKAITPAVVIAELSDVYQREQNNFWERDLAFITTKTTIIELTFEIAIESGKLKNSVRKKHKTNFGLADAIILATALKFNAVIVAGDKHFEGLQNVQFLGD